MVGLITGKYIGLIFTKNSFSCHSNHILCHAPTNIGIMMEFFFFFFSLTSTFLCLTWNRTVLIRIFKNRILFLHDCSNSLPCSCLTFPPESTVSKLNSVKGPIPTSISTFSLSSLPNPYFKAIFFEMEHPLKSTRQILHQLSSITVKVKRYIFSDCRTSNNAIGTCDTMLIMWASC